MKNAAVVNFDFTDTEVGHGFKLLGQNFWRRFRRRHVAVIQRLVMQPFPNPAVLKLVVFEMVNVDGVFAVAMRAIIVFVPKIKLVAGLAAAQAIDERLRRTDGVAGGRRIKRIQPGRAVAVGDDETVRVKFAARLLDGERGFAPAARTVRPRRREVLRRGKFSSGSCCAAARPSGCRAGCRR